MEKVNSTEKVNSMEEIHSTEEKHEISGTTRQAEEAYLEKTLSVVRSNVRNYGRQVSEMREEIDDMLEHFHDDNPELINALENSTTLYEHMKRALERNEKALSKPYFGRIVFWDESLKKEESLYIGRGGIASDATHQIVVDWRAPVANTYYENGLGKCSYMAPGDKEVRIDLKLKRTYEIEKGKLQDYFDSEVIANDELLTKYLARNKQAVLGEIVATIQKEQNEIIRKSPYHNVIVQGVAGSGKTTVAMHRISFILYNYQERFKPEDFYIVGSNRILLNYITGVLPDLDVYGIKQMTMEQLFIRLLYEDWDEKKYSVRKVSQRDKSVSLRDKGISLRDKGDNRDSIKGTLSWFQDLKAYCDRYERDNIIGESIYLNPKQFVEGLRDGKSGVYDETVGKKINPGDLILLMDREAVARYISQTPNVSLQSKINMLNDRLTGKIKDEFLGKGVKYSEVEKKAILRAYRNKYGPKVWKGPSIYQLYHEFLLLQASRGESFQGMEATIPDREFDVYDLAALAYLYKRVKETEVISEAHHIVIDEAQDFGMMAYAVLDFCIHGCTYTIMGDVSQNIHFGFGLNDWEELKTLLLPDQMDSFGILKKSYRNTVEISEFATNILHHGNFSSYPVEPIIRHGDPVKVMECKIRDELIQKAAHICKDWLEKGFDTIAVVCRDQKEADRAARELSRYVEIIESDLEKAVFSNGIMVLPVEYTKGLEFDTVLILDPDREAYPADDGHAKLLYVAATRALHELCVLHTGNLTGLIADPLPAPDTKPHAAMTEKPADDKRKDQAASDHNGTQMTQSSYKPAQVEQKSQGKPSASLTEQSASKRPKVIIHTPEKMSGMHSASAVPNSSGNRSISAVSGSSGMRPVQIGEKASCFGDMPPTEKLRPAGHSRLDLSVRWVTKQPDGLYLQSRYGILRISPVGSAIVRISFCRNGQPDSFAPFGITVNRTEKYWMYKESGNTVELTTDELLIQADKTTGALRYLTRDKKLLVGERSRECRMVEKGSNGLQQAWLFLEWAKGEHLYGFGPSDAPDNNLSGISGRGLTGISLRGSARYLSDYKTPQPPFLLSDKGYGIVLPTKHSAFCCDIAAYGSYLYTEWEKQLDFYFITGKRQETIVNAYEYLCGKR